MAHHAQHGPSRINRIINARHRRGLEKPEVLDDPSDLLAAVEPIQAPLLASTDTLSPEPCDPLQNMTCPDDSSDGSDVTVEKREVDATPGVVIQTVVQVVDTNSNTLWRSVGTEFPMTISDPAFGVVTVPGSTSTAPVDLSLDASIQIGADRHMVSPTAPASQPTASTSTTDTASTASTTSATTSTSTTSTSSTTSSKHLIPISSPKGSPTASSQPHSVPVVTSTTSGTSEYYVADIVSPSSTSSSSTYLDSWGGSSSVSSYATSKQTSTSSAIVAGTTPPAPTSSGTGSGTGSSAKASTPQIVGGVVGSVAGVAVLILLLLFILRRRQFLPFLKNKGTQALPSESGTTRGMSEQGSTYDPRFSASYFAPAFMKRWRNSTMTAKTDSTADTNSSERGFQKVAGRKIPPVLTHGGDGYGGGLDGDSPTVPDCLIGITPASPVSGPPPTSPYGVPLDTNVTREADETLSPKRPPNVRLPSSNSVRTGMPTTITQYPSIPQPQSAVPESPTSTMSPTTPTAPVRPDGVGRSLPSYDGSRGSRGSRFTESLDL